MVQAALKNPFAVGVSLIKTYFHSMNDVNAALAEITSLTYSNPCYLPPGGVPPNHHHLRGSEQIAVPITSSSAMSEKEVRDLAYFNVRPQLGHVRVNVVRINDNRAVYLPL